MALLDFTDPSTQNWLTQLVGMVQGGQSNKKIMELHERHHQEQMAAHRELIETLKRSDGQPAASAFPAAVGVAAAAADKNAAPAKGAYSKYAPEMDVSVGCIPCTRAHLATTAAALKAGDAQTAREEMAALVEFDLTPEKLAATPERDRAVLAKYREEIARLQDELAEPIPELTTAAASLKEALRFAREDGMEHPEVQVRMERTEEVVNALERVRLSPEEIRQMDADEQAFVRSVLPQLRAARQKLLNETLTPSDLEATAAMYGALSRQLNGDPDPDELAVATASAQDLNRRFRADVLRAWKGGDAS